MEKTIYIINGINDKYSCQYTLDHMQPNDMYIIQGCYSWYGFLDTVEQYLSLKEQYKDFFLDCCIDNRLRLNQLLNAIATVSERNNMKCYIKFITIVDSNEKLNLDQRKIFDLMSSVEYYKYPLSFISNEEISK